MLMGFYRSGREAGQFDQGIEMALARILASPQFVYRIEEEPANLKAGQAYRLSDQDLASRLSFFLWSTGPDDELMKLASQGRLKDPAVLEQQARRMLQDPRAEALAVNFAGQWLNLRGLQSVGPLPMLYPDFDDPLRQAMRREVELLFDTIVREDRSVVELLTADYTFVNERLARHYGIPYIYGSQFRRVTLGPEMDVRRGLLGKGAFLTTTSKPERTSPVTRGKWIMTNILGMSPPDPPADVPPLKPRTADATGNARDQTMRQKMLDHRVRADCIQCHRLMDPIGFALENFDAIATWRSQDEGTAIDASGEVFDNTKIDGPVGLRNWLTTGYSGQFVSVVTEKLLTYALGRGDRAPGHAAGSRDRPGRRPQRQPVFCAGPGRRQEQAISDEHAGDGTRCCRKRDGCFAVRGFSHVYYQTIHAAPDLPARRGRHTGPAAARSHGAGVHGPGPDRCPSEEPLRRGFFFPHGMAPGHWEPATEGVLPGKLPYIMESLENVKDQTVILSGLWSKSAEPPEGTTGSDHWVAAAFLTGIKPKKTAGSDATVGSPTIDQSHRAEDRPGHTAAVASACRGRPELELEQLRRRL